MPLLTHLAGTFPGISFISPGTNCVPFLAWLLSDALGSAQGCSRISKWVDCLWCKTCMKPLRLLFLQQAWWVVCLTEKKRKKREKKKTHSFFFFFQILLLSLQLQILDSCITNTRNSSASKKCEERVVSMSFREVLLHEAVHSPMLFEQSTSWVWLEGATSKEDLETLWQAATG